MTLNADSSLELHDVSRTLKGERLFAPIDLVVPAGEAATLSGGQRTRVTPMRSLLSCPRALLLAEPFSKRDVLLRDRIRRFVFDHARANGIPTFLVTHNPADAEAASGRTIELP